MEAEQIRKRLKNVKPSLGRPSPEEKAVLFEDRADRARQAGMETVAREYGRKATEALIESNPETITVRQVDTGEQSIAVHQGGEPDPKFGLVGAMGAGPANDRGRRG